MAVQLLLALLNICLASTSHYSMSNLKYDIVMSEESFQKMKEYKNRISSSKQIIGKRFERKLLAVSQDISRTIEDESFLELLLSTKKPTIFAESSIKGDGGDWNKKELEILGDVNVVMAVTIYDNGVWPSPSSRFTYPTHFKQHEHPFEGELLFTPGALLSHGKKRKRLPDLEEVISGDGKNIDQQKYNKLIIRRLLPLLVYANEKAGMEKKKAIITMPGIGCGAFSGQFRGNVGVHLNKAMKNLLELFAKKLTNILLIHYDPFSECDDEEYQYNAIMYRVRPSFITQKNREKTQLSHPSDLEEVKGEFENTKLFKIVAWDHVSLPGNDFLSGSKWTDDGVTAGGTDAMKHLMGGIEGHYNAKMGEYCPPRGYRTWGQYAEKNDIHLIATKSNVKIVTYEDCKIYSLSDYEKKS